MLFFILFISNQIYSQNGFCREVTNPNLQITNFSNTTPSVQPQTSNPTSTLSDPDTNQYPDFDPSRQYVYKVIFHIFRDDNGVRATTIIGEADVMNVIRDLNLNYNQFNIFFKYGGYDFVDNTSLTGNVQSTQLMPTFGFMLNNHTFQINILDGNILDYDENGNIVNVPGVGFRYSTIAFFSHDALSSTRIATHEIGHCLNLFHDFKAYSTPGILYSENVIRDQLGIGYNATSGGDKIHDTPATKIWDEDQYNALGIYEGDDIDLNYALISTSIDRLYKTEFPRKNNIMHVHSGLDYTMGYFFSPGQGKRMRWSIGTDIVNHYGIWELAEVNWKELYQPFETKLIAGDAIVTITPNQDGTGAEVCRNRLHIDRFQKGFNQKFINLDGSAITVSGPDDLVELDRTFDYALKIEQYNTEIYVEIPVD